MTRHSFMTAWNHHGRSFLDGSAMSLPVHTAAPWRDGEDGDTGLVRITSQHQADDLFQPVCEDTVKR
jgi:hypothetical protein